MPEVIVIDEIGTELEAHAARTIAERGVQLVGTAHGNTLENLMANPTLADLIGGIQSVTLGDEEARRRGTQKSILERKAPPTFPVVVELQSWNRVALHIDVAETVDAILRGYRLSPQIRELTPDGTVRELGPAEAGMEEPLLRPQAPATLEGYAGAARPRPNFSGAPQALDAATLIAEQTKARRIYPFGISRRRLQQAMKDTASASTLVDRLEDADVVLTERSYYRRKPLALREAESRGIPIFVLKNSTLMQMQQALLSLQSPARQDPVLDAMTEAEEAIHAVIAQARPVELTPQRAYIRRLQHELAQRFNLSSTSRGKEPQRRVRILPDRSAGEYFASDADED
jgi:hypothetical protein